MGDSYPHAKTNTDYQEKIGCCDEDVPAEEKKNKEETDLKITNLKEAVSDFTAPKEQQETKQPEAPEQPPSSSDDHLAKSKELAEKIKTSLAAQDENDQPIIPDNLEKSDKEKIQEMIQKEIQTKAVINDLLKDELRAHAIDRKIEPKPERPKTGFRGNTDE